MDRHQINIFWSDEDDCFVADIPDLQSCSAFGDTPEEALAELQIAKKLWIEVASEKGTPIPPPSYRPPAIQLASEVNDADRS